MTRNVDWTKIRRDGKTIRLITMRASRFLARIEDGYKVTEWELERHDRDRPVSAEVDEGSILD
jgi:hypothetical protein